MLALQKFIYDNPDNWYDLLSGEPYNLKISIEGDYALFKYNQILSDFGEIVCREARGVIIHIPTIKVVRLAFTKFFNVDEPYADKLDWSTAHGTEKIDGSIMTLWYDMGEWHLSTNGTINAYRAQINNGCVYETFGQLFDVAAKNVGLNIDDLDKAYNYTFELVSPFNRVVIRYDTPALYLLSVRDMLTLEEVYPIPDTFAVGVPRPMEYNLNSEEDYRQVVSSMGDGHEGIVIRDAAGRRVKVKTLLYFQLHRTVNNGNMTLERVVSLVRANDYDEFLSYFPEYVDIFNKTKVQMDLLFTEISEIQKVVDDWKKDNSDSRKLFAQNVALTSTIPHLYFAAYDGRLTQVVDEMSDKKLADMLEDKIYD